MHLIFHKCLHALRLAFLLELHRQQHEWQNISRPISLEAGKREES